MQEREMRDLNQDELVAIRTIQRLTRRDFMKALGLTAIAVTSTTGLTSLVHAASQVPQGVKFMTGNEYQVMNRLMQVMLPTAGTKLVPTDKIPVMQTLDAALLATMEPHILQGLKGGIEYFNQGPKAKYGKTFVEYLYLKNFRLKNFHIPQVKIIGENILEEIIKKNKPVIFVSGHFANFELMSMEITKNKINLATIYRPLNNFFFKSIYGIFEKKICM